MSAILEPFIEQFMPRSLRLSFPSGVPTDLKGLTLEEAEEKNRASSKPLPLTAGLLIQTIKALALSNPCFTFTVWAFRESYNYRAGKCFVVGQFESGNFISW